MIFDAYKNCRLCPRDCKIDRAKGVLGFCGESSVCRISFIGPHFGEEPSFTGTRGSGTIFFSGCSSQCFFCQNYQISIEHEGRTITPSELLFEARSLIRKGVHNLNFVTPDHFWPHIQELCRALREEGIKIPMLFNCSGYQRPEKIREYAAWMDIFLPDFKFAEPELAQICMGDERYPELALEATHEMVRAKGFLRPWDVTGNQVAKQGVLVRHLVLPGHTENSLKVLRTLYKEFGPEIPLSVMSQFRPVPGCEKKQKLTRTLQTEEYGQVLGLVRELGFEKVYTQELREETSFLPDFHDPSNPFPGNSEAIE
jgi:putative pyruvate formate lyase activating enzyme